MRALMMAAVAACIAGSAQAQAISGPCAGGYRWSFDQVGIASVASYGECAPSEDYLNFICRGGDVTIRFEVPLEDDTAGQSLNAAFRVDGQAFALPAKAVDSEMLGGVFAEMDVTVGHALFQALGSGSAAELEVAGETFPIHLKGSGTVIDAFREACR